MTTIRQKIRKRAPTAAGDTASLDDAASSSASVLLALRRLTWHDVAVFFPKLAARLKMYWRRRRDNADLVKTLRLVECEETRIDNVLNLVDELDWWRPETVAQHCGDEIIMPLVDASMACWGTMDRLVSPLKNKIDYESDEDMFGSFPEFHPIPPPRKTVPVAPPRKFYPGFLDKEASPVPPPRKKYKKSNQIRNVKG